MIRLAIPSISSLSSIPFLEIAMLDRAVNKNMPSFGEISNSLTEGILSGPAYLMIVARSGLWSTARKRTAHIDFDWTASKGIVERNWIAPALKRIKIIT